MNKEQRRILFIILISLIIITVCSFSIYYIYNTPKLVLKGDETITINLYEKYNELGATAYIQEKELSDDIKITNNINENEPGNYKVTYSLKNSKIERNVIVKDNIAPVIKINGGDKVVVKLNTEYHEDGATVVDNINGDISDRVEISGNVDTTKLGNYYITYTVKDEEGNVATAKKEVIVAESDTYVRVSIENQTIEVFKDNKLIITSPIVTGTEKYTETDKGTFKIYYKARNVYLKGVGYLSYVNYWMPYNGGEGLHDATWREEFGKDIYKTNGSHGCVNMPLEIAEEIYNAVNVGTIVEVY